MKKNTLIIISVSAIFFFNTCALEIANVLGPDGGYVFYDKGGYTNGWRYIQCAPHDFIELRGTINQASVTEAIEKCMENSEEWYKFGWELPTEAHLRKMLECFSYGLTKFSPDYYYIAVNNLYAAERWWVCTSTPGDANFHEDGIKNTGNFCTVCGNEAPNTGWIKDGLLNHNLLTDPDEWVIKILHKNFSDEPNGAIEEVTSFGNNPVRVRAIRRF